jgi:type IV pilus assembly protein PilB
VKPAGLALSDRELRDLLVTDLELVTPEEFEKAVGVAARRKLPLERAVSEQAKLPFRQLLHEIGRAWGVPFIDLKVGDVKPEALRLVREETARAKGLVAYGATADTIHVAMMNPRDRDTIRELSRMTNREVKARLGTESSIRRAQLLYHPDLVQQLRRSVASQGVAAALSPQQEAVAADALTHVLEFAAVTGASDIHIEPFELEAVIRYRIDGVLHEVMTASPSLCQSLTSRIKVLSGLRVDEKRAAQDGRFEADLSGVLVDLRVSTLPTMWGEKTVMRVLSRDQVLMDIEGLGFSGIDYELISSFLTRPHGMVLVTGPTGSGKTSTLYAFLMRIGSDRRNIVNLSTIEDPIEYTMPRVNQVPVNPAAGMDFANGLRALLRQDPDVIMVGEIRDRETADTATRAALVGRLLFSSLHTNDSTSAVARMLDMGAEPYLLASTLAVVVAQRLVRRLCPSCRGSYKPDAREVAALRSRNDFAHLGRGLREHGVISASEDWIDEIRFFRSTGCNDCRMTGYRGRVGIFEIFPVTDAVRPLIIDQKDNSILRQAAITAGMRTMFMDGVAKAVMGETSLEEVFRAAL